ncbi:MAG: PhoU domain-containing protein [Candidatus Bathyarchaeia archaeon]
MEIRKLQKIRGGSFTLTLPKQWVEKRKLATGEQIAVSEEEDGSLRLHPLVAGKEKPLEVKLSLEDYPDLTALEYCVETYYIQGSNQINIFCQKIIPAEQKRRLKQLRMELPGVEVAEESAEKLSFQVLIDPTTFSLESLIEKTSSFSLHLQEDAIRSVLDWNFALAKEVLERSREAQRHYRMTIRQVALSSMNRVIAEKVGVKNCRECITFALIARDLSRLVYHSSSIARHILSLDGKKKANPEIMEAIAEISKIAYEMQREAVQAFLQRNVQLAIVVFGKMRFMREKEEALLKKILEKIKDVDTAVALSMIARDLRRIAGYAVAVADDAMNRVLTPA